jgi:arylsulfatase A-like enzyme
MRPRPRQALPHAKNRTPQTIDPSAASHSGHQRALSTETYYDGAQTDVAIEKLGELAKRKEPFFFGVGYYRPHLPFNAPKKYWDLYDRDAIPPAPNPSLPEGAPLMAINTMRELIVSYHDFHEAPRPDQGSLTEAQARRLKHGYYASVSYVDAQIGRLLDRLRQLGLWENTIVVLWGDHGWKLGEHNSWCKMTNFEIDARVPLIMRLPGAKENGQSCDRLVEFVDIYPSLCEAAGLPIPESLEGLSFVPLLKDRTLPWKPAAFSQFLREGKWVAPDGIAYMGRTIRTDRYRYVGWRRKDTGELAAEELYDHQADPLETVNVASRPENRPVVAALAKQLDAGWRESLPEDETPVGPGHRTGF